MGTVSIADAKAYLSERVERAAGGETVQITRRGKPVAQIVAAKAPRKPGQSHFRAAPVTH